MKKPIEICKWGKPKTYKFIAIDEGKDEGYTCEFGGAIIALPMVMQAVLFHDLLLQAGYTPEPDSICFAT